MLHLISQVGVVVGGGGGGGDGIVHTFINGDFFLVILNFKMSFSTVK